MSGILCGSKNFFLKKTLSNETGFRILLPVSSFSTLTHCAIVLSLHLRFYYLIFYFAFVLLCLLYWEKSLNSRSNYLVIGYSVLNSKDLVSSNTIPFSSLPLHSILTYFRNLIILCECNQNYLKWCLKFSFLIFKQLYLHFTLLS